MYLSKITLSVYKNNNVAFGSPPFFLTFSVAPRRPPEFRLEDAINFDAPDFPKKKAHMCVNSDLLRLHIPGTFFKRLMIILLVLETANMYNSLLQRKKLISYKV